MKKILILIAAILLTSCISNQEWKQTKDIQLRQLTSKERVTQNSSAGYFLVVGSYSSSTEYETKVRMFGDVGGYYKFIEVDIEDIRVRIDNSVKKPYCFVKYYTYSHHNLKSREKATENFWGYNEYLVIVCPEKYLPEKLLPIEL